MTSPIPEWDGSSAWAKGGPRTSRGPIQHPTTHHIIIMASARLGRLSHHLPSLAVAFFVARDDDDDDSRARSTFLSSVRCEAPPKKASDGAEKKKEEEGLVSR